MDLQTHFSQALFDSELTLPPEICAWNQSDPTQRFAVYRNNVIASLINALVDTFPVCYALVGEEFFRGMAGIFVHNYPPKSRILAYYGSEFADFIAHFPPAASVPYLADMARLEYARVMSFHALDEASLSAQEVADIVADQDKLPHLHIEFQNQLQLIVSDFAIASIWGAHQVQEQEQIQLEHIDPTLAESALILRFQHQVEVIALSTAEGFFVHSLIQENSLSAAAQSAFALDADFDLSRILQFLMQKACVRKLFFSTPANIDLVR